MFLNHILSFAVMFLKTGHDSFSASFCDRVILLKDGMIYKQLDRIGSQNSFQGYLLDTIKEMSEADQAG